MEGKMAAVDLYLELEGVKGESKDKDHKDQMELQSWAWGVSNQGYYGTGTGGAKGKGQVQDLTIIKHVDKSSVELFKRSLTGKHIDKGKLTAYKAAGDGSRVPYLQIELKKVYITGVNASGSGGEIVPTESVSMNFEEFRYIYTPQNDDGSKGAEIPFAYNLSEHADA
jgi:type VI secretion system secreted protein Hcp